LRSRSSTIGDVADRMQDLLDGLPPDRRHLAAFLSTYRRTTLAVGDAVAQARFEDPEWVEQWDVAFAQLYLDAYDAFADGDVPSPGGSAARPWRLAFGAPADLPALRLVLLGINAHVNYDLPQALLAVIGDDDFADPVLMARRQRDHARIDGVLASRVAAEDGRLSASAAKSALDKVLTPLNRLSSKRFLREAREKVWRNTFELQRARLAGPDAYRTRLAELELLSAAKIADLLAPGQVLLRLAVSGFGVTLPPP
jgi:hypothetical protein